jgi:DNA-binding NarL/FixJ family response regulator
MLLKTTERIVVHAVDHCPIVLEGLGILTQIDAQIMVSEKSISPETALEKVRSAAPNVLILQPEFPNFSVEKFCQTLFEIAPNVGLVAYVRQPDTKLVKKMRQIGAKALLDRSATASEMVEAIHAIQAGGQYIQPSLARALGECALGFSGLAKKIQFQITKREKEVLSMIVNEMTTREISEKLFVSPCTIETHRLNLIQKMVVKNTAGLVRTAILNAMI